MIATSPEVVEYIEGFEDVVDSLPIRGKKLSDQDQIFLYTMTKMFEHDPIFRAILNFLIHNYAIGVLTLPRKEFRDAWINVIDSIAKTICPKGGQQNDS